MKNLIQFVLFNILILFFLSIFLSSCTFDNEEDLLEDYICDSIGLVYSDLTNIFNGICEQCHGAAISYNGIRMDTYENVRSSVNTGKVVPAINHEPGSPQMPNGLPKLSDCNIKKIEAWINAGMPEN